VGLNFEIKKIECVDVEFWDLNYFLDFYLPLQIVILYVPLFNILI